MPNEDPVREMTICHPPQREEINPGTSQLAWDLKLSCPILQGVLFYILFLFKFQFATNQPTVFTPTLKSKFNSPFLASLKSFVRRKPIPVFDPRPLYCSSLTMAVGGTKDTNFVDSDHPTVARINPDNLYAASSALPWRRSYRKITLYVIL